MTQAILNALDLLNSYVRSESCRDHWDSLMRLAVYVYKTEFIRVYVPQIRPECYVVQSSVKCRDCGGSGRYVDAWGYKHDHCWACNSSGTAKLRFVETRWPKIVGRILVGAASETTIWHTPTREWPSFRGLEGYNVCDDMRHKLPWATNYKPNQPGRDAELIDVVDALSTVERWYWESGETRPPSRDAVEYSDYGSSPVRGFIRFKMNIGYRQTCPLCGTPSDSENGSHNCRAGGHPYLDWGEPVHAECYEANKENIWDVLKLKIVPPGLCDKTVMKFLRTHGAIVEKHGPTEA